MELRSDRVRSGELFFRQLSWRSPRSWKFSHRDIDNMRSLIELKPGGLISVDGIFIWGGTFWELRKVLTKDVADNLLYRGWDTMTDQEFKANNPKDFVASILKAD